MDTEQHIYSGATLRQYDYVLEPFTDYDPKRGGSEGMPRDDELYPSTPVGQRSLPAK